MTDLPLTARRIDAGRAFDIFPLTLADLRRFPDAKPLGRLTMSGFFRSDDRDLTEYVASAFRFQPRDLPLPERLALVRKCWEGLCADRKAESDAEIWAENAWLRAAEAGTPDTWADEDRERAIEFYGYGPPA
jgi:hypothetical protein